MDLIVTTKEDLAETLKTILRTVLAEEKKITPIMVKPQKEIINVEEACELINLAKQTLYGLTCKGKIPHFKRGKKLLFRRTELVEWLEEGRQLTVEEEQIKIEKNMR